MHFPETHLPPVIFIFIGIWHYYYFIIDYFLFPPLYYQYNIRLFSLSSQIKIKIRLDRYNDDDDDDRMIGRWWWGQAGMRRRRRRWKMILLYYAVWACFSFKKFFFSFWSEAKPESSAQAFSHHESFSWLLKSYFSKSICHYFYVYRFSSFFFLHYY